MNKIKLFLILQFLLVGYLYAQVPREIRAVWLTTNLKLDWPPNSLDEKVQKNRLREIFKDLKEKNFNTVYFQVRSNGTVMYNSDIEPFSPYFTGVTGQPPSYDPLQLAIDLGKEFNLEVHAWVNMIRCFAGSDERFLQNSKHLRNSHPNWTVRYMDENGSLSYWLNPGFYEVQDYLVDLLVELTSKYDIDGIHLDFFRYPGKEFDDAKYFKSYGLNVSLDDWRRNNITTILRKFKERAKPLNSYLKVGATPIGIRKNLAGASGWEGYSSVYQDTETWLREGLVDYLTPQIYWNFEKNPRFDILAKDWVDKSYSRNIVLGLAAYKNDVYPELNKMIEYSRSINASGVAFFRYENISSKKDNYYSDIAFPTDMPWKVSDNQFIPEIFSCTFEELSDDEVMINWDNNHALKNPNQIRYYVLYDNTNQKTVSKIISLDKRMAKLKFANPAKLAYNYNIGKIDRLWNEVNLSNPILVKVPYLNNLKNDSYVNIHPILISQNNSEVLLSIHSYMNQKALVNITSKENVPRVEEFTLNLGKNIIRLAGNIKFIKSIKINFESDGSEEFLNLF